MQFVSEILLQLAMLDAGIVPFAQYSSYSIDESTIGIIDKRIASMTVQDQRAVKRKFRKLWRKALKKLNHQRAVAGRTEIDPCVYGRTSKPPSPAQRNARRTLVLWYIRTQVV